MKGRKLPFPAQRRLVLGIVRAARSVPAFPIEMQLDLGPLQAKRKAFAERTGTRRMSWTALFAKGWGLVGQEAPILRRVFLDFPWSHFYEHPTTVASISVHRREAGASADELVFCRIYAPESLPLSEIQTRLEWAQTAPIGQVGRDARLLAQTPWPFRNWAWWLVMHAWGYKKSRKIGTFSISSLAGQGANNFFHPLIVTTSLCFAPVDSATGRCRVTLLCDHRTLDGYVASELLQRFQTIMNEVIAKELS